MRTIGLIRYQRTPSTEPLYFWRSSRRTICSNRNRYRMGAPARVGVVHAGAARLRTRAPGVADPRGRALCAPRAPPAPRPLPPPRGAAARGAHPRRGLGRDRPCRPRARVGRDRDRPRRPPGVPGPLRAGRRTRPAVRRRGVRRRLLELGHRARGRALRPPRAGIRARPRGRALLRADPEPLVPGGAPRAAAVRALASPAARPAAVGPRRLDRPLR